MYDIADGQSVTIVFSEINNDLFKLDNADWTNIDFNTTNFLIDASLFVLTDSNLHTTIII